MNITELPAAHFLLNDGTFNVSVEAPNTNIRTFMPALLILQNRPLCDDKTDPVFVLAQLRFTSTAPCEFRASHAACLAVPCLVP